MKGTRMSSIKHTRILVFILLVRSFIASAEGATNFTTIFAFNGTNGQAPEAPLIQGSDGNFYGTAMEGGIYTNYGTIFQVTPDGIFRNLHSFDLTNGAYPEAGLTQGADGYLYGTAYSGGTYGDGVVYRMSTNGTFTVLAPFLYDTDGYEPNAVLLPETNGNFYGMTMFGGSNSLGSIFSITPSGMVTTLASFNGTNGAWPYVGGLIRGADGNFYGTIPTGGIGFDSSDYYSGFGTVFKMTPEGQLTTLALFNGTNGAFPVGLLVQGLDGCLYGTTCNGGIGFDGEQYSGNGTVFKITTNGSLSTLVMFNDLGNGANPFAGLCLGTDGNFYGTTQQGGTNYPPNPDGGTVFQMTPNGTLTTLVSFNYNDGSYPMGGVVQGSNGDFYGTTTEGSTNGFGGIFRLGIPSSTSPHVQVLLQNPQSITLSWKPLTGHSYQVQYVDHSNQTNWVNFGAPMIATNGSSMMVTDSINASGQRYYRVVSH